jgi:pimeloyl-ACP methyl ester carboxylesterase
MSIPASLVRSLHSRPKPTEASEPMSKDRRSRAEQIPVASAADEPCGPPSWLMVALEGRAFLEWMAWCVTSPIFGRAPAGDGHPVLVLPGLMANDHSTWPLRHFLQRLGYTPYRWGEGTNRGPSRGLQKRLSRRLQQLGDRHGAPVSLVGWSLGGLFARAMAWHEPERVRSVITLGSPLSGDPDATNARRVFEWASGRRADDPALKRMLGGHPPVPVTSFLSKTDGVVHWRASLAPRTERAESIEVPATHLGMGVNPIVLWAIADRLAQDPSAWQPFERSSGWRSLLYRDPHEVPLEEAFER